MATLMGRSTNISSNHGHFDGEEVPIHHMYYIHGSISTFQVPNLTYSKNLVSQ